VLEMNKERVDLDRLVHLGEDILKQIEDANRHTDFLRMIQMVFIASAVMFAAYQLVFHGPLYLLIPVSIIFVFYIVISEFWIRQIIRRVHPNLIALHEISQILHEVEGAFAMKEEWSTFERVEFRIRLLRFNVDPRWFTY
jgi:hypothetical protein